MTLELAIKLVALLNGIVGLFYFIMRARGPEGDAIRSSIALLIQLIAILGFMLLPFAFFYGARLLMNTASSNPSESNGPPYSSTVLETEFDAADSFGNAVSLGKIEQARVRAVLLLEPGHARDELLTRLIEHLMRASETESARFLVSRIQSEHQQTQLVERIVKELIRREDFDSAVLFTAEVSSDHDRRRIAERILEALYRTK